MIAIDGLSIRSGSFSLAGLRLHVPEGRYAMLMGRTGSGKSTILEAICGLRPVTAGSIRLCGRDVTHLRPAERGVGYVPQDRALFPMMTVRGNLGFGLRIRGHDDEYVAARVQEIAELLGIGHLLHRLPAHLSGGEAQRVALGRALSWRPGVLLLDEPLSALDEQTREGMYGVLEAVKRHAEATVLHVTHNNREAERLADVRLVLTDGQVRPAERL